MSHRLKLGMNRDLVNVSESRFLSVAASSYPNMLIMFDCLLVGLKMAVMSSKTLLCYIFRNPSASSQGAKKMSKDPSQRIQNLNFLVQQIKTFYLVSSHFFLQIQQQLSFQSPLTSDYNIVWVYFNFNILDDLEDQLVLLKIHGLNFSHVNICVIGTGAALEHSQSQSKAAVRVTDRALD